MSTNWVVGSKAGMLDELGKAPVHGGFCIPRPCPFIRYLQLSTHNLMKFRLNTSSPTCDRAQGQVAPNCGS
jgi:hypothetical protein